MSITREQLEQMKRDVASAEREFENDKAQRQRAVLGELVDLTKEIDTLIQKAEAIANAVGLRFYYNAGYEEFTWCDEDTWNSSFANC